MLRRKEEKEVGVLCLYYLLIRRHWSGQVRFYWLESLSVRSLHYWPSICPNLPDALLNNPVSYIKCLDNSKDQLAGSQ